MWKANVVDSELKVFSILEDSKLVTLAFKVESKCGIKMLPICYKDAITVYSTSATKFWWKYLNSD